MAMAAAPMVKVIYGKPMLPDVARVLACLHEKEIKFELEDMNKGIQMPPDVINLQISSHGHAPGLQDGTDQIFGSRKICRHIVEKYGAYGYQYLLGKDPLARVTIEQWIQSEEHNFDPPSSTLVFYLAYKFELDEEPISQSEKKLVKVLNLYEQRLGECEFLGGNYFTLADLYHLPNSHYLNSSEEFGHLFKDRKNVSRWWRNISSRKSWKNVVQRLDKEGLQAKFPVVNNEGKKPPFPPQPFPGKNGNNNKSTEEGGGKKEGTKTEGEEKGTPPPSGQNKEPGPREENKEDDGESKQEGKNDAPPPGKDQHSAKSNKEFDLSKGDKNYETGTTNGEDKKEESPSTEKEKSPSGDDKQPSSEKEPDSRKETAGSKAKDTPPGNHKNLDQNKENKKAESGADTEEKKDTGDKKDGPTSDIKDKASSSYNKDADPNKNKETYRSKKKEKGEENKADSEAKKDSERSDAKNKGSAPDKETGGKADKEGNNEKTPSNEKKETPHAAPEEKNDSAANPEKGKFPSGADKNPDPRTEKGEKRD